MGCRSNSSFRVFKRSTVHRTSWRAYRSSSSMTVPLGSWLISFWFCVRRASHALFRECGSLNRAQASVRRSKTRHMRRVLVPTLYVGHSSGLTGFVRLKNAALESFDVTRMHGRSGLGSSSPVLREMRFDKMRVHARLRETRYPTARREISQGALKATIRDLVLTASKNIRSMNSDRL